MSATVLDMSMSLDGCIAGPSSPGSSTPPASPTSTTACAAERAA
jgi:hypothetical protein